MRDVLRVDAAALLANGVGNVHQQRARARRGVVATDIADFATHGLRHQDGGHDLGHGMRGVVLSVFAAAVLVVVLDQVLEQRGIEVVLLVEDALEAEITKLVDDGAAKGVALGGVGDELADPIKQGDLGATVGFDSEDVVDGDGDVAQGGQYHQPMPSQGLKFIRSVRMPPQVSADKFAITRPPPPYMAA